MRKFGGNKSFEQTQSEFFFMGVMGVNQCLPQKKLVREYVKLSTQTIKYV